LSALVYFFFELCLLRRAPQDLPASSALLGVALAADLSAGALLARTAGVAIGVGLAQSLVDVVLTLSLLYSGLGLTRHRARFVQTATAVLGSGALLGVLALVPVGLLPSDAESQGAFLGGILFLALIGWSVLVTGHILRHAFELTLAQGVGIAVAYNVFLYWLVAVLFPGN
jgi:hypothetical protein